MVPIFNGELDKDEETYMQEPLGYETGSGGSSVKRLRKSLYSLKQAGRKWYDALRRLLGIKITHNRDARTISLSQTPTLSLS